MPTVAVLNMQGKKVGKQELSEAVFGIEPNVSVMNDMVKNYLANQRQGTQSALTRSGSFRRRQKAVETEGYRPRPSGFDQSSPVDPWRYCVCAQAQKLPLHPEQEGTASGHEVRPLFQASGQRVDRDRPDRFRGYKTKAIAAMLKAVGSERKALIVLDTVDEKVIASARNIPGVKTAQVNTLNVYDILNADKFIVVKDAVAKIEEVYA